MRPHFVLSIGKLAAGQAKYYLDQAEVRVDVVQSVGGGIEDYYVGPSEARGRVDRRRRLASSGLAARSVPTRSGACSKGSTRGTARSCGRRRAARESPASI